MLKFLRREFRFQMRAQEGHAVELVGIKPQPHPDQMQMIRHEAIGRTEKPFAGGSMQEQFAKHGVKRLGEPALPAVRDGERPLHHRVALIIFTGKTRQIKRPVEVRLVHENGVAAEVTRLKLKFDQTSPEPIWSSLNQSEPYNLGCHEKLNSCGENNMSLLTSAATSCPEIIQGELPFDGLQGFR